VITLEPGAHSSGQSDDRLIRFLVLRLEEDLHAFTARARELAAAHRAPGPRFFALRYGFTRRVIDIRYALGRHAAAARDIGADATTSAATVPVSSDRGNAAETTRRASVARGLKVSCPRCGAASGAGCRTVSGASLREPHAARRVAAHALFLDELHPQRDSPWVTFAPTDEEVPVLGPCRLRDPHDPLGERRRLRHLLRALEEDLPLLSEHLEERWRMRRRTLGPRYHELVRPLFQGIREVTALLQRLALPGTGP
jgi:hypothetical protein